MTQLISQISGSISALNGVVGPVQMLNASVLALISGTFVGTMETQVRQSVSTDPTAWVSLGDLTAPGYVGKMDFPGDLQFRVICTAYTSGTANVYLATAPYSG
jgi:hypothetical protein